jgi:hypothetical protein
MLGGLFHLLDFGLLSDLGKFCEFLGFSEETIGNFIKINNILVLLN